MEMSNDDVSDPTAVSIALRFDRKGVYNTVQGATYTDMMTCQDTKIRFFPANNAGPFKGYLISMKIHALPSQYMIMSSEVAPGVGVNTDYWDPHFWMSACRPNNAVSNTTFYYFDTIEMLFDGYEEKL